MKAVASNYVLAIILAILYVVLTHCAAARKNCGSSSSQGYGFMAYLEKSAFDDLRSLCAFGLGILACHWLHTSRRGIHELLPRLTSYAI
mmetsp:Transcript_34881/g.55760  ORF Transcript_34881/g.55760 Transcript_34881/m.55760 type:complete len:89 (-) Transcript_34881:79-345(-)